MSGPIPPQEVPLWFRLCLIAFFALALGANIAADVFSTNYDGVGQSFALTALLGSALGLDTLARARKDRGGGE